MKLFELFATLDLNYGSFERGVRTAQQIANRAAQTIGDAGGKIVSGMESGLSSIVKTATIGYSTIQAATLAIGKQSLDLKSDVEQGIGGSEAVFGAFADSVQRKGTQAFDKAGLALNEYMSTANKMGALFKGAGFNQEEAMNLTTEAMQRAADVASIMGIDVSTAMESISGAAKGNFTMMDNLGVAMNDTTLQAYALEKGIGKSTQSMTNQEKVTLAMAMFMERTAYAAGNYAKENQTVAGSLQTLKGAYQNFLSGAGQFEDLQNAAFNYIRIAAETMGMDSMQPLIDGAEKTVGHVVDILSMEGLDGRAKYSRLLRLFSGKAVGIAENLKTILPEKISSVSDVVSETLSTVNLSLPRLMETGETIFSAVRQGIKDAADSFGETAGIIAPNVLAGVITGKSDMLSIGLGIIDNIAQGIKADLDSDNSKVKTALSEGIGNALNAAADTLPSLVSLAGGIIDALSDSISGEQGAAAGEIVSNMIDSMISWIDGDGVERVSESATAFLLQFGAAVISKAPDLLVGAANAITDVFKGVGSSIGDIFDPRDENVKKISENLESVKTAVKTIKEDLASSSESYENTLSEIEARAALAENALSTIEMLEKKDRLTVEEAGAWKNAIVELVKLYPEIKSSVDQETGFFTANTSEIRKNILALQALSREKAFQNIANQFGEQGADIAQTMIEAQVNRSNAQSVLDDLQKAYDLLKTFEKESVEFGRTTFNAMDAAFLEKVFTQNFGNAKNLTNYFDVGLNGTWTKKKKAGGDNNAFLFGLYKGLNSKIKKQQKNVSRFDESISEANKAMEELQEKQSAYYAAYNEIMGNTEAAAGAAVSGAESVTAAINAIPTEKDVYINVHQNTKEGNSHAHGLNYVPYDNYAARLHRGEMVLTRQKAEDYRNRNVTGQIDYEQLGNAVAYAMQRNHTAVYIDRSKVGEAVSSTIGRNIARANTAQIRARGG